MPLACEETSVLKRRRPSAVVVEPRDSSNGTSVAACVVSSFDSAVESSADPADVVLSSGVCSTRSVVTDVRSSGDPEEVVVASVVEKEITSSRGTGKASVGDDERELLVSGTEEEDVTASPVVILAPPSVDSSSSTTTVAVSSASGETVFSKTIEPCTSGMYGVDVARMDHREEDSGPRVVRPSAASEFADSEKVAASPGTIEVARAVEFSEETDVGREVAASADSVADSVEVEIVDERR